MRFTYLMAAAFLYPATLAGAQAGPSADSIRHLAPAAFPNLPVGVRRDLETRGCSVPQPWDARQPSNVILGAFTATAADEWAVLCSVRDTSRILIYRGTVVDSLQPAADRNWMQGIGDGRWGYSRLIQTMPLRKIRAWRKDFDGHALPQPVDHDAIEQVFLDKAAEAFYYAGGRWYRRSIAD